MMSKIVAQTMAPVWFVAGIDASSRSGETRLEEPQKRWCGHIPLTCSGIVEAIHQAIGIILLHSVCRIAGIWEPLAHFTHHRFPVPPVHLRRRTGSGTSIGSFLSLGRTIFQDLERGLAAVGKHRTAFQRVCDFGCGCGRVLRWFAYQPDRPHLTGADIDREAIAWCRRHFPFAHFVTNGPLPPCSLESAAFDLVYVVSVFTHLDEAAQFLWLEELRRIMQPGGYLLLSVLGESAWGQLPSPLLSHLTSRGFLFVGWDRYQGLLPVWRNTAYHHQAYVHQHFARYFDILAYSPQGINHHQDLVILRKP